MSKYKDFNEYLNNRGKLEIKGKVSKNGDVMDIKKTNAKDDPHNRKNKKNDQVDEYLSPKGKLVEPIESENGDTYQKSGKTEYSPVDGNPYRASEKGIKPGNERETGFGDTGAKELVYNPKTDVLNTPTGGEKVPFWSKEYAATNSSPATKTESFIQKTCGMNKTEFAKYMLEEHDQHQIQLLANRMRSKGTLGDFLEAVLEFPEVKKSLRNLFAEAVAPPVGIEKIKPKTQDLADVDGEDELLSPEGEGDELDDELEGDLDDDLEGDLDDELGDDLDLDDDLEGELEDEEPKQLPPPKRPFDKHPMMKMMQGM